MPRTLCSRYLGIPMEHSASAIRGFYTSPSILPVPAFPHLLLQGLPSHPWGTITRCYPQHVPGSWGSPVLDNPTL